MDKMNFLLAILTLFYGYIEAFLLSYLYIMHQKLAFLKDTEKNYFRFH